MLSTELVPLALIFLPLRGCGATDEDMRLLNVHSLEFQVFPNTQDRPPYVITSHRWVGGEISYQQFCDRESRPEITETSGYQKVIRFCEFVREWGADLYCPSRDSTTLNVKGYCDHCFESKFICDKKTPICSNCRHACLQCQYKISIKSIEEESKPSKIGPPRKSKERKSCRSCVTDNRKCSRDSPTCSRCHDESLTCDYGTALDAILSRKEQHENVSKLDWVWIDTCCIDKSSSTELSEAINSMFKYYAESYACLAYLHDVRSHNHAASTILLDLQNSSWFTRGWTLQELLAPGVVVFLNQSWEVFGHKAGSVQKAPQMRASRIQMPLNNLIAQITGIPPEVLLDYADMQSTPAEDRMQWGKGRNTTREEDKAYCLLGICDVFMLPMYGEGERGAFDRLRQQIKSQSDGSKGKNPGKKVKVQSPVDELDFARGDVMNSLPDDFELNELDSSDPILSRKKKKDKGAISVPSVPQDDHDEDDAKSGYRHPSSMSRNRDDQAIDRMLAGGSGRKKKSKEVSVDWTDAIMNPVDSKPPEPWAPTQHPLTGALPVNRPRASQFHLPADFYDPTDSNHMDMLYDSYGQLLDQSKFPRLYGVYKQFPAQQEAELGGHGRNRDRTRRSFSPIPSSRRIHGALPMRSDPWIDPRRRSRSRDRHVGIHRRRDSSTETSRGSSVDSSGCGYETLKSRQKQVQRLERKLRRLRTEMRFYAVGDDGRYAGDVHAPDPRVYVAGPGTNIPPSITLPSALPNAHPLQAGLPNIDESKYRWVLQPLSSTTHDISSTSMGVASVRTPASTIPPGQIVAPDSQLYDALGRMVIQPSQRSSTAVQYPQDGLNVPYHRHGSSVSQREGFETRPQFAPQMNGFPRQGWCSVM